MRADVTDMGKVYIVPTADFRVRKKQKEEAKNE
jgi:hypothetical protein